MKFANNISAVIPAEAQRRAGIQLFKNWMPGQAGHDTVSVVVIKAQKLVAVSLGGGVG
jgi:hypothetical protein